MCDIWEFAAFSLVEMGGHIILNEILRFGDNMGTTLGE